MMRLFISGKDEWGIVLELYLLGFIEWLIDVSVKVISRILKVWGLWRKLSEVE